MRRVWSRLVRCCLASLGTSCSDVCEIFSGLATVASRGKSGQGENGGRSGEGVDDKSMAWGCEVLLGVIVTSCIDVSDIFSEPAMESSRGKSGQGENGGGLEES